MRPNHYSYYWQPIGTQKCPIQWYFTDPLQLLLTAYRNSEKPYPMIHHRSRTTLRPPSNMLTAMLPGAKWRGKLNDTITSPTRLCFRSGLSLYLCAKYQKRCKRILMKFFGGVRRDFDGSWETLPLFCHNFLPLKCLFSGIAIVYCYLRDGSVIMPTTLATASEQPTGHSGLTSKAEEEGFNNADMSFLILIFARWQH